MNSYFRINKKKADLKKQELTQNFMEYAYKYKNKTKRCSNIEGLDKIPLYTDFPSESYSVKHSRHFSNDFTANKFFGIKGPKRN